MLFTAMLAPSSSPAPASASSTSAASASSAQRSARSSTAPPASAASSATLRRRHVHRAGRGDHRNRRRVESPSTLSTTPSRATVIRSALCSPSTIFESVQEIETELEVSRRMASIGRLTAGVGTRSQEPHQRDRGPSRTAAQQGSGRRRCAAPLDIIQSEIRRLDRVVQTLVDFSRPVELQLKDQDLRAIVSGVLMLASADFQTRALPSRVTCRPVPLSAGSTPICWNRRSSTCAQWRPGHGSGGLLEVRLTEDTRWPYPGPHHARASPTKSVPASSTSTSRPRKRAAHRPGHDLPHSPDAPRPNDVESKTGSGTTFVLRLPAYFCRFGTARSFGRYRTRDSQRACSPGCETQPERSGP